MDKTVYVSSLSASLQLEIRNEIYKVLEDCHEYVALAMESRLCDLDDVIDITKYL